MSEALPMYPDTSMSGADLFLHCQAPSLGVFQVRDEPSGPPARFGNGIHLLLQWYIEGGPVNVEAAFVEERVIPSDRARFERVWENLHAWLCRQDVSGWRAEVAYALDPRYLPCTARELGRGIKREYEAAGKLAHEFAGTADIIIVEPERVTVLDLKTGRSPPERYRMQLLSLGLAASIVERKPAARVGVLKADEAHVDVYDAFEAGPAELAWMGESIHRAWTEPSPEPMPGEHCAQLYCKARKVCPQSMAMRGRAA